MSRRGSRRLRLLGPVLPALLRQRRRLILAALAIAIGVGYLAGALGLLNRIGSGLEDLANASADDTDLVIEGGVAYESELEQVRRLVPAGLAEAVSEIEGVSSVSHRLEDVAYLVDAYGDPVVPLGLTEQPLASNWPEDPDIVEYSFLRGGPPGNSGEIAIDARSAERAGVTVGDQITIAGKGPVAGYEVVGVIDPAKLDLPDGSSLAVLETGAARVVFDRPLDDNRIAVVVEPGADVDEVAARVRAILPPGIEVVDGETAAVHQQEGLTRSFTLVRALVSAFGVLALLVGMSTVANSLGLLHAERRQLYASFRLVGARRAQLRRAAMGEAMLLALVSSVVGIPLGLMFAWLIERAMGSLGTAVPTSGPVLTWQVALWAIGLGVAATALAAWRPVSRASDVAPVEALSPEHSVGGDRHWPRVVVVLSQVIVALAVALGVGLLLRWSTPSIAVVGAMAAVGVVLVGTVPWVLSRLVGLTISLAPVRPKPLRRIAARDAVRSPRRTAFTAVAVMLAVSVVAGLAVFLASFTRSLDEQVGGLVTADLVVDSGTFTRGGLPGDLLGRLGDVEGVEGVSGWQLGRGTMDGQPVRLTGLDGASALSVVAPDWKGEPPSGLDEESVWVSEDLAAEQRLQVGDTAMVTFTSGGTEVLQVEGIYASGSALLGEMVTDRQVLLRQVPATVDIAALVSTDGAASTTEEIRATADAYGVDRVLSPGEFIDSRAALLRGFQRVVLWMLLFTLVQAVVGLVNTLFMSVGERRREFGLLRVAGSSRSQVLRMVLFEAAAIAVVGTVAGLALGVGGAWLAVQATASLGLGSFAVPVTTLVAVAAGAVGVGVLAAVVPAAMASRVAPLEAVVDTGVEFIGERRAPRAPAMAPTAPVPGPVALPAPVEAPVPVQAALPSVAAPSVSIPVVSPAPLPDVAPPPVPAWAATPVQTAPGWVESPAESIPVVPVAPAAAVPIDMSAPVPVTAPVSVPASTAPPAPVLLGDDVLATALAEAFLRPVSPAPAPVVLSDQPAQAFGPPASAEPESAPVVPDPAVHAAPAAWVPAPVAPVAPPATEIPVVPVAATPVTVASVTAAPVTVAPVTVEPVTVEPVAAPTPSTSPPTVPPPVAPPPTVQPSMVQPSVAPPPTVQPPTVQPPVAPPPTVQPSMVQPSMVQTPAAPPVPPSPTVEAAPPTAPPPPPVEPEPPRTEPEPVELPPVVAVPIGVADDSGDHGELGGSGDVQEHDDSVAGEDGPSGESRRERIRRKASVRFPRRKARLDSAGESDSEGWLAAEEVAEAEPPELDPAEAARITDETLAAAVRRLDPTTVLHCAGSLSRAGLVLAPGEWVSSVVCGQVRDWPATVVRTDRRILVVVDRPDRPIVESLHPLATGVSLEADPMPGRFTVTLVDRGRRLEIHGVVELAAAESLLQREELLH